MDQPPPPRPHAVGRGAQIKPPNRFLTQHAEDDWEHLGEDEEHLQGLERIPTEYLPDESRSFVTENDSPDIPFRYSANPYRGCAHGCAYCYARPYHEYLGLNAGLDFETKIFVKHKAPELFLEWLARPKWQPEPIAFSGVTDCYQPAERQFRLTRGCLEVARDCRQPITVIAKNALVARDLDLLAEMAARNTVRVALSITTLDAELARAMEPRTSPPALRLQTIARLAEAGVPTMVMTAPIIPGLTDSEIPALLAAAKEAGAVGAGYVLLRLPFAVKPIFLDWLARTQPTKSARVESLIRQTRAGALSDPNFGSRMRGGGPIAEQIERTFRLFARKHGLDARLPPLDASQFEPPVGKSGQRRLF